MALPGKVSDTVRRLNPNIFGGAPVPTPTHTGTSTLRQKSGPKLNKLETMFLEVLQNRNPEAKIHCQSVTLVLGNGVRYTPDFVAKIDGTMNAWETKGFMRDDAAVKIKVAAGMFPEITFWLVTRDRKEQAWRIERVLP